MGSSTPGMHSTMMHHSTSGGSTGPATTGLSAAPGTTGELEDPPGLYEKVLEFRDYYYYYDTL